MGNASKCIHKVNFFPFAFRLVAAEKTSGKSVRDSPENNLKMVQKFRAS